jgi:long-chain acyl-CoA synthetase
MDIDLEIYRRDVRVSYNPEVKLSVIDVSPDHPVHTMVFLHGFGGQATQWGYQIRQFSGENRVIALDQRGHGRSDRPSNGYTMDRLLDDLIGALDYLGIPGKISLIGHSFGGAVATEFAVRYPERINYLALIASAAEYRLNPYYRSLLNLPTALLGRLARVTAGWLSAPPDVLRAWYVSALRTWQGQSLFERIQVPTLVIRGHQDRVFEKPAFDSVARAIPGAVEANVGHSGHMVMIERRDAVNREIERFINLVPQSWRQERAGNPQDELLRNRPWLDSYDRDVPYTIAIPTVPLPTLLTSAARRFPKRLALIYNDQQVSYQELDDNATRFAQALHVLGLQKGERVMLLLPNNPALVTAYFGVLRAGGVVVFSPPDTPEAGLINQVKETGVRFILLPAEKTLLASSLQQIDNVEWIIYVSGSTKPPALNRLRLRFSQSTRQNLQSEILQNPGHLVFSELLNAFPPETIEIQQAPQDLAIIAFTGGTTASPKGVMLSHRNLLANTIQVRHWIPEASEGKEIFLSALSLSHSYGFTACLNVPVSIGATILLKDQFDIQDILNTIRTFRPTIFPGVPRMYLAINNFPGVRAYGIDSIKACISGSSPLPVEVQEAFERLTKGKLVEGYGLTEASPVTHANPLDGPRRSGSIGLPLPSTEAKIVDLLKGEQDVPTGQIGELAIRGPQVMLGYWQDPEATQAALHRDGWLLTGDVAQMDSSGFFHIIARKADMWYPKKPGDPAFPRDVEEVIYEIPQVHEVVVMAIAGQPVAFVITGKEKPSREVILSYCKRRLPPDLVPRLVVFVDEFPRTFVGKVLRRELARVYEEHNQGSAPTL